MHRLYRSSGLLLICVVATIGCMYPSPPGPQATSLGTENPAPSSSAGPRRLIVGIADLEGDLGVSPPGRGINELRLLVRGGLTTVDDRGVRRPELAETVPTLENGLWTVLPDGRMETIWKLKPTAAWHDGTPFTSDDLVFSLALYRDREVSQFNRESYAWIDDVSAQDAHTVSIRWSRPFIEADELFSHTMIPPFPKHLLGRSFDEEKAAFTQLPFWRETYVGAGAFKVRDWVPGSHALLEANERYVLGRPKIDQIEVRFIADHNTRMASVLAGAVDLTMGAGFSTDQGMLMREQWHDGQVALEFFGNWVAAVPQFVDPQPSIVTDVRFRRALLHAIDRQEMADTLQFGLSPVAHSFLSPNQPQYQEIEAGLARYDYDPRQAAQMIESLGYARAADGVFRDGAGQRLELDIRTGGTEITPKTSAVVADAWGRLGIPTSITLIPPSRRDERGYMSTFPAFRVYSPRNDVPFIPNLHSSRSPLPENNFRLGGVGNASRYHNAELDSAVDRYLTTIPQAPRTAALGQIIHHIADQLTYMGFFYNPVPELVSHRLLGVTTGRASAVMISWNAHEWDVRS